MIIASVCQKVKVNFKLKFKLNNGYSNLFEESTVPSVMTHTNIAKLWWVSVVKILKGVDAILRLRLDALKTSPDVHNEWGAVLLFNFLHQLIPVESVDSD